MQLEKAIEEIKKGKLVLLYDGRKREGEVDFVLHPKFCTQEKVRTMRRDGGGLVCFAARKDYAQAVGLTYMTDVLKKAGYGSICCKKMPYGDPPAFSLSVNARNVFTGISDDDRERTIKMLYHILKKRSKRDFFRNFYSPGHVPVLITRKKRKGHTEMAVRLMEHASLEPMAVLCEMVLPRKNTLELAEQYAKKHKLVLLSNVM